MVAAQPERAHLIPSGTRVALVTGASRGIGEAIALKLAQDGLDVVVNDIQVQATELNKVSKAVTELGRKSFATIGDVSDPKQIEACIDETVNKFGRLDVVVANAGIVGPMKEITEYTMEEFAKVHSVNVLGVFNTISVGARVMKKQGWGGRIIAAASIAAHTPGKKLVPYSASKFAVKGMIQGSAQELGKFGIRCNAYAPGMCETQMLDILQNDWQEEQNIKSRSDLNEVLKQRVSLGRMEQPSDVAKTVGWLACPESEYVTGQTLITDGGIRFT